jgi:hypothetical protein
MEEFIVTIRLNIIMNLQMHLHVNYCSEADAYTVLYQHKSPVSVRCDVIAFEAAWLSLYEGVPKSFRTESITKYTLTFGITHWEATQRVMAAKLTRPTHKIAIQLHLVAESCTICSSRSRRTVRKLLDTPSYVGISSQFRRFISELLH